ncbi:MAG: hypothetical protein LBG15_08960 [Dysgonamonadaceae bacterium]|jgi:hypothetical protein|nr:hypothetical protein [Dysgonamonadaceae bacterium]
MKRNIISLLFLATLLMAGLSSCEEPTAEKNENINLGNPAKLPTVTINDASDVTFEGAVLSATIALTAETDSIIETGFIVANNEAFLPVANTISFNSFSNSISSTLTGLTDKTTFYVKAYAVTYRNGTTYSNRSISFTTLEAPKFEDTYLFGTYDAIDINVTTDEQEGGTYPVEIKQVGTLYNRVSISNIWGGEETIEATVDFVAKTITTDDKSVIYVDPSYGDCWMRGFDIVDGQTVFYVSSVDAGYAIADYDDAGHVSFRYWAARVSAGHFGFYVTKLTKK